MGCDGGTIPTRDELVKTKKKPEQKDKMADLAAKWKHCAISQEPLTSPIISCQLGRLYNKETVLEFLLDRTNFECAASFSHLRGLKDIKELKLTENPGDTRPKVEKGDGYIDTLASKYICPVVGVEMNGMFKFCFPWTCGCVMSERALKEVKSDMCHKCGEKVSKEDIVILNGTEEDVDLMRDRMQQRKLAAKLEKKARKAEKKKSDIPIDQCAETNNSKKVPCLAPTASKLTNGATTKTAQISKSCTTKNGGNGKTAHSSSSSSSGSSNSSGTGSKLTNLQKDSKNSSVYKSLFTSSEECKKKPEQHWITYNPLYF